jgi:hypothetical protein
MSKIGEFWWELRFKRFEFQRNQVSKSYARELHRSRSARAPPTTPCVTCRDSFFRKLGSALQRGLLNTTYPQAPAHIHEENLTLAGEIRDAVVAPQPPKESFFISTDKKLSRRLRVIVVIAAYHRERHFRSLITR